MTKHAKTRRPRRAPYSRKPYTPQATQVAIQALAMSGANDSQIGKLLKIDRETVGRILTKTEMEIRRSQGRSIILDAVPKLAAQSKTQGATGIFESRATVPEK